MLISKPLVVAVALLLASYAVVLVLVVPDAWNDSQHASSVTFKNMTDETLCSGYSQCDPGGAVIKPHSTAHWVVGDSCRSGDEVRGEVYTNDGELIYSRTVKCAEWKGSTLLINKRSGEFVVADDFDSSAYVP